MINLSGRMESLELNRQIFKWFNVYPADKCDNRKALYRTIAVTIISTEFFGLISSIWFIVENLSTQFEHCLHALSQTVALTAVTYMWTVAFIQKNQIVDVFKKLKDIRELGNFFHCSNLKISILNYKFTIFHFSFKFFSPFFSSSFSFKSRHTFSKQTINFPSIF